MLTALDIHAWEFLKIRGTFLEVPIIRIILYWGLNWGPPILVNYHILTLISEPYKNPLRLCMISRPFQRKSTSELDSLSSCFTQQTFQQFGIW